MTPEHPEDHLPDALRASKLPWLPDDDGQAAAPRGGDGWRARLGELRFELLVDHDPPDSPFESAGEPPTFQLRLLNTHLDRETSSWELDSLETAAQVADSIRQMLVQELLHEVRRALHQPHAA